MRNNYYHKPVMLTEALQYLQCHPGGVYVDATLGGGGYSREIAKLVAPDGFVIGIDKDFDAIVAARKKIQDFAGIFQEVHDDFANLNSILKRLGIKEIDGIVFDLGVSSYQLEAAERGFSFKGDSYLDMRMDQSRGKTAAQLLAELTEDELAHIFHIYGEEKWTRRIASFIVSHRSREGPIERASDLVEIIKQAIPAGARRKGRHPARRIFQALRIAVNGELEKLQEGLKQGIERLKPGGIICVISYHSLEDRIVKKTFAASALSCSCPPHFPICVCNKKPRLKVITPKPVLPSPQEVQSNPRARSARLRAAKKLDS